MTLRYKITVDKESFQEFYWMTGDRAGLNLASYPQPDDSSDFVVSGIENFRTGEDVTVKILREYSAWLNTRD